MFDFDRINKKLNKWLLQSILLLVVVLVFGWFITLDSDTRRDIGFVFMFCVLPFLWAFFMAKIEGDL